VSICVVDEASAFCFEAKSAAEMETVVAALVRFGGEIHRIGFEAGTRTQYLTHGRCIQWHTPEPDTFGCVLRRPRRFGMRANYRNNSLTPPRLFSGRAESTAVRSLVR